MEDTKPNDLVLMIIIINWVRIVNRFLRKNLRGSLAEGVWGQFVAFEMHATIIH